MLNTTRMFFFLSKLSYIFIQPANWMVALLIWRIFSKSAVVKRRLSIALIALFLLFGNEVIYTKLALAWQRNPVQLPPDIVYEAGILPGGISSFDRYGNGFLNEACDRLVEISILYKTGRIKKVIITGGSVINDKPKEAPFLYKKMIALGVSPADIITEDQSRTTYENAAFTKRIVDSLHLQPPFVLVTSAMHLRRAEKVFNKAGLPVVAFPSDYKVIAKKFEIEDYIIPSLGTINDWNMLMKEVVGLLGYKLFNKA